MVHAQKPDFVFRRNGRVHLNRQGRQFSRLLAAEVCASAVVMLDTPRSEVVWRVLATHSIRQFPLHFPSRASSCAITLQLDSNTYQSVTKMYAQYICRPLTSNWKNWKPSQKKEAQKQQCGSYETEVGRHYRSGHSKCASPQFAHKCKQRPHFRTHRTWRDWTQTAYHRWR